MFYNKLLPILHFIFEEMTTNTARPDRLVYTLLLLAIIAVVQLILIVFLETNNYNPKVLFKGGNGVLDTPVLEK